MSSRFLAGLTGAALASGAWAQIGDPNDIYALDDARSNVYQYDRTTLTHVPGNFTPSGLGGTWTNVFSNSAQTQGNAPYVGAVAGANQNFFIGGFGSLTQIDSTTGAFVSTIAGGQRLGPCRAPNGNIVVGGPTGVEEYNSNSGAFVRTVTGYGNGANLHAFMFNEMFVADWNYNPTTTIKRFDFITGLSTGADIVAPFGTQEIGFGTDLMLYATSQGFNGAGTEGLWRCDPNVGVWTQYIDTTLLGGGYGFPHGFTFDPQTNDIYMAFNSGQIHRWSFGGADLGMVDAVPTKLTDILFKVQVPEPATLALLALGGLALLRRR